MTLLSSPRPPKAVPLLQPPPHTVHSTTQIEMKHLDWNETAGLQWLTLGLSFCMLALHLSLPCATRALVCGLPKWMHFTFFLFSLQPLGSNTLSSQRPPLLRAALRIFWVCCSSILVLTFDHLAAIPPCPSCLMASYPHNTGCRVTTDVPS